MVIGQSDSLFIERDSKLVIKPNFLFQNLDLTINGAHGDIVSFEPGNTGALGVTLYYKWFVGSFYYGVYNESKNGSQIRSTYQDFRFNFSKRRAGLDVNFQWYKGFSIKEFPASFDKENIGNVDPNLELFSYGFNFYYSLNKDFSVQSIYKYNEMAKKSSGSVIVGLHQNYTQLSYTNSIFPDDITDNNENEVSNNDGKFFALIPTLGYQYNLVKNKFHVSPTFSAGIGGQYQSYMSDAKGDFKGFNTALRYNVNLPIGYNGEKSFFGVIGRYDKSTFFLERGIEIHYALISLQAYFGIRF